MVKSKGSANDNCMVTISHSPPLLTVHSVNDVNKFHWCGTLGLTKHFEAIFSVGPHNNPQR